MLLFSFGLFALVLLEVFAIIRKHLCHRLCLLSLNNGLLFLKIGVEVLARVFEKKNRQCGYSV